MTRQCARTAPTVTDYSADPEGLRVVDLTTAGADWRRVLTTELVRLGFAPAAELIHKAADFDAAMGYVPSGVLVRYQAEDVTRRG